MHVDVLLDGLNPAVLLRHDSSPSTEESVELHDHYGHAARRFRVVDPKSLETRAKRVESQGSIASAEPVTKALLRKETLLFTTEYDSRRNVFETCLVEDIELALDQLALGDPPKWSMSLVPEPSPRWIYVRASQSCLPEQGWKLHVSATSTSAREVLQACLPILLTDHTNFKLVSSPRLLHELNRGHASQSQVGKFITIYPPDESHAVRLAVALDKSTRGLRGPTVRSDWKLRPGSLVHYRYGGFRKRLTQTLLGEILPAISAPDGELIPDRRPVPPTLPSWLIDPFITAGCAAPAPRGRFIASRYLLSGTLHRSPRGAVVLGIDCKELRPCVLKIARRDDVIESDGRDARDRLRHEASILVRLGSHHNNPRIVDLVEEYDSLYLVMNEIAGDTLFDYLGAINAVGRHPSLGQIIEWGRSLAAIVAGLHHARIIHSDLNAKNVLITPGGDINLIDFELAHDMHENAPTHGLGTRGYVRPERRRDDPPTTADDIFAVGAILYFAATGAEPSQAPQSSSLLRRPLAHLNPAVPMAFANVIGQCLAIDPAGRFASMVDLREALEKVARDELVSHPKPPRPSLSRHAQCQDFEFRSLAHEIGHSLCHAAQPAPAGEGLEWTSTHDLSSGVPSYDINIGSAGAVLALAALVAEIGDPFHREVLTEAARRLISVRAFDGSPLPGLYVGQAGIGTALLRAGQVLGDRRLIAAAEQLARQVSNYPFVSPDLFHGTAGRMRFHLWIWSQTTQSQHLGDAVAAGEELLATAIEASCGGLSWRIPEGYGDLSGSAYLGYAHGAAGIADALLDLFAATADERFLTAAARAGRWLAPLAIPALDDQSGLTWPIKENGKPSPAFWCHGSTGIGKFLLHAAEYDLIPGAMDLARRAAKCVAHGLRWSGPTQCHGLAGNIEFLLDMYQRTHDPTYLDQSNCLGRILQEFGTRRGGRLLWPSETATTFTPDYMVGYAGVATAYLRLSAPDRIPHQMSLAGLSSRGEES